MSIFRDPQASITAPKEPTNQALIVLTILAALGLVIGTVLLIAGATLNTNTNPYTAIMSGYNPFPGLGAFIWGAGLLGVGAVAAVGWLTVVAVKWSPPQPATPLNSSVIN